MPPGLLEITGVLPFTQTIFLWQSLALTAVLIAVSAAIAWWTAPAAAQARTAAHFADARLEAQAPPASRTRPGEWLEFSPLLTVLLSLLAFGWLGYRFASAPWVSRRARSSPGPGCNSRRTRRIRAPHRS